MNEYDGLKGGFHGTHGTVAKFTHAHALLKSPANARLAPVNYSEGPKKRGGNCLLCLNASYASVVPMMTTLLSKNRGQNDVWNRNVYLEALIIRAGYIDVVDFLSIHILGMPVVLLYPCNMAFLVVSK